MKHRVKQYKIFVRAHDQSRVLPPAVPTVKQTPDKSCSLADVLRELYPDIKDPLGLAARALSTFKGVDLITEARRAHMWEQSQAVKKKNHGVFLGNWWGRALERKSESRGVPGMTPSGKTLPVLGIDANGDVVEVK